MANEETFFVVVSTDELAGNFIGITGFDLTGLGMKDINPINLHPSQPIIYFGDVNVGSSKDDKQVPCSSIFKRICHVEIGIHLGFEEGDPVW